MVAKFGNGAGSILSSFFPPERELPRRLSRPSVHWSGFGAGKGRSSFTDVTAAAVRLSCAPGARHTQPRVSAAPWVYHPFSLGYPRRKRALPGPMLSHMERLYPGFIASW